MLNGPLSEQDTQGPCFFAALLMLILSLNLLPARILHCEVNYFTSVFFNEKNKSVKAWVALGTKAINLCHFSLGG